MAVNEERLHELLGRAVIDFGATYHAPLVMIGDRLGLYRELAGAGPLTPGELAERTGTAERYIREWLNSQAAGGYVTYHPRTGRYSLSEEQVLVLADENSPTFMVGAFQAAVAGLKVAPRIEEAFRTGEGLGWDEQDDEMFHATERLFRPGYAQHLVSDWIPSLEGVEAKLRQGARVADVGAGHGASTILMAQAYPSSEFVGFDYHELSVQRARQRARDAGVADRVHFEVAGAESYPGRDYDLVTTFDCLHDMGDPAGAAAHIRETLKPTGTWMIVEPFAGDRVEENLNPLGRAFYSASTLVCTPCSLNQEGGRALGAQAGEARIRGVAQEGGFTRFRRATETPFNLILEARP